MFHLGIIGAGNISETHARAAQETGRIKVAAVFGQNSEKAERLALTYKATAYQDLESLLKHRPLDIVAIGSPSGLHAVQGIAAAQQGLHVLVEKPIDVNLQRADELIEHCQRARVKLGVFFQDRVAPDICKLKEMVDQGRLGKPILVSAQVKWYRPPEYYGNSRWRGTWALDGGGALINQGIHTVDLLLWLLGDIERVSARTATLLHQIKVEDTLVATLEFANGALGTLEVATSVYPGYARRVELSGSEGTLILEQDRLTTLGLREQSEVLITKEPGDKNDSASSPVVSNVGGHRRIFENFLLAIDTNVRPRCDGQEGRRSLEVVQAIYRSAHNCCHVEIRSKLS